MQLPQAPPNGLDPEVGYMSTLIEGDRVNAISPSNMVQQHSKQAFVDSQMVEHLDSLGSTSQFFE
jgi:hypothetical protein